MKTYTKLIMNYLEGEMNYDEEQQFKKQLENDPALKSEYLFHKKIDELGQAKMLIKTAEEELQNRDTEKALQELYADTLMEYKSNPEIKNYIKSAFDQENELAISDDILEAEKELNNPETEKDVNSLYEALQAEEFDKKKSQEIRQFIRQGFDENDDQKKIKPKTANSRPLKLIFGLAAAAAAAIVIIVLFLIPDKLTHDEIYSELERPIELGSKTEKGSTENMLLSQMTKNYNAENYALAEKMADSLIISNAYLPEAFMVKASVNMLMNNDYATAVKYFEKTENISDKYMLESYYFKMLCYLKLGKIKDVKKICYILKEQNVYTDECDFILTHIE